MICDIIPGMRKSIFCILSVLSCIAAAPAHANWEYSGTYLGDGWYNDDGSRFVMSVRAGASFGVGKTKNNVGNLTPLYYMYPDGDPMPEAQCGGGTACEAKGLIPAGFADLGELPLTKDFESFSFAAGASLGWTIPNRPQWRLELGWDHIAESEYNASPFLEGETHLFGGNYTGPVLVSSGAVQSKVSTDIISLMAFYDFFDGLQKPTRQFIPYVGFGAGYADSKTTLSLSDPYGDLTGVYELFAYGELDEYQKLLQFKRSKYNSANVAGIIAAGVSYGITQTMFLDFGGRLMYIPKVKWKLSSVDDSRERDWFSVENMIYANIMLGLRFEF